MAILITLSLLLCSSQPSQVGWRGIIPLHSTRADVERLLGPGTDGCKCGYYLSDVNLSVVYSSFNCENCICSTSSGENVWNVPNDTVLRIVVYPKIKQKFSSLDIDKTKFKETHDGHLAQIVSYVNGDQGLTIEVNQDLDLVMGFYYGPATEDQHLRCSK